MYCPRCAQQQISEEMRFCSRCGLPLSGLIEWLTYSGAPAARVQEQPVSLRSPRRRGIRRGAKVMFFSAAVFPFFLMMSFAADHPMPLLFSVLAFIVGLTITLYSWLFGEEYPAISQSAQPFGLGVPSGGQALPPASNIPMYGQGGATGRVRTNELAQPPSVTEQTTRLLDNE